MEKFTITPVEKIEYLKKAIKTVMPIATAAQKRTGNKNSYFIGNPIGYEGIDDRLRVELSKDEYFVGFAFGFIGNNRHKGTIINNASDVSLN